MSMMGGFDRKTNHQAFSGAAVITEKQTATVWWGEQRDSPVDLHGRVPLKMPIYILIDICLSQQIDCHKVGH
jgi:hypothetical protein